MTDFNSAFRDQLAKPFLPLPSAHEIAVDVVRRDQRRTRILAVVCLVFWIAAVAGMALMVAGLNEFLMGVRLGNARRNMPAAERGAESPKTRRSDKLEPSADDAKQDQDGGRTPARFPEPYWDDGTSLFHHTLPLIAASLVLLLLAGASTILLIFSSRRTTLNRISISLAQLSSQLKELRPAAPAAITDPGSAGRMPT